MSLVVLLEGKTLNGVPEIPFGVMSVLLSEEAKLLLSWLAIGDVMEAIFGSRIEWARYVN